MNKPPVEMSERARSVWVSFGDRDFTNLDVLRAYCETVADIEHAERQIRDSGTMVLSPNGDVKLSPWVTLLDSKRRLLMQLAKALGIDCIQKDAKKKKLFK